MLNFSSSSLTLSHNTAKVHTSLSSSQHQQQTNRLLFQNPLETTLDAPPRPGKLNTNAAAALLNSGNNSSNENSNKSFAGRLRQTGQLSPTHNLAIPMGGPLQDRFTEMGGSDCIHLTRLFS